MPSVFWVLGIHQVTGQATIPAFMELISCWFQNYLLRNNSEIPLSFK